MNCRKARGFLSEYLDGTLPENPSHELEKHLNQCENCALLLKEMQQTVHLLHTETMYCASPDFLRSVRDRIDSKSVKRPLLERILSNIMLPVRHPALAGIFTVLLALLIGVMILIPSHNRAAQEEDSAYIQAMMVDHGNYAAQQPLADGSNEIFHAEIKSISTNE